MLVLFIDSHHLKQDIPHLDVIKKEFPIKSRSVWRWQQQGKTDIRRGEEPSRTQIANDGRDCLPRTAGQP
jgi:hypothetical protein